MMELTETLPALNPGQVLKFDDGTIVMGDKEGKPIFVMKTWASQKLWRTMKA